MKIKVWWIRYENLDGGGSGTDLYSTPEAFSDGRETAMANYEGWCDPDGDTEYRWSAFQQELLHTRDRYYCGESEVDIPTPRAIVTVEGGVVQDVECDNCEVEVRDYDTDGADEANLETDGNGAPYVKAIYE